MTLEILISIFSARPHTKEPKTYFEKWSAVLSWFFIVTEIIFLILFIPFLIVPCQDPIQRFEKYKERVGAVYKNINFHKYASRLMPLVFVFKRVAFAVGCFYIKKEMVTMFIVITLINLCYIIWAKPYVEHSLYKLELFNESVALIFFTHLQAFNP
jgi:hypothetical protein